jgi:threonine efflux protein
MNLFLAFLSLFTAWFLVLTIPGPNFVAVTQYSLSDSRRTGFYITLGVSVGAATWATASLVGISALFAYAGWLYDAIRVVGGLYLIYLGGRVIVSSLGVQKQTSTPAPKIGKGKSAFRLGLFTSFSNPKTAAFFSSLFVMSFPPQAPIWFYLLVIGMVFSASVIWYGLVAYFFSIERVQVVYQRFRQVTDKLTGAIFIYLGARLAFSKS